jgi:hypothetical protein
MLANLKQLFRSLEHQPGTVLVVGCVLVMPGILAFFQRKLEFKHAALFAIGGSLVMFALHSWLHGRRSRPSKSTRPGHATRAPLTPEGFPEGAETEGIAIDFCFEGAQPAFGDLFQIGGDSHPAFPPSGRFNFQALARFGFEQVDDYYGIKSSEQEGADVVVWLYPLVGGDEVCHHHGPYDGVRLAFNILRNSPRCAREFTEVVSTFAQTLPARIRYPLRDLDLGNPPDLSPIEKDIERVTRFWRSQGIEPGSVAALEVDP